MGKHIALIQGHPDPNPSHFGHALGEAYTKSAEIAGHEVKRIVVARLDFPVLRTREEWEAGAPPTAIRESQDTIRWADHLVILYPLWLGSMPALLKAYFEQVFRPDFAIRKSGEGTVWEKLLTGKSARIVVTMGMPAFVYRWFFLAHSLKSLERNILGFSGIGPIRENLIGMVEAKNGKQRERWVGILEKLGRNGR